MSHKIHALVALSLMVATPSFAAAVSGTVKFNGEAPKFKEIKMEADPVCVTHHTEAVYPQTLVLGEGGTMGNVFVYIKNAPQGPAPTSEVVIDQKGCMYEPHVVGVQVGQTVKILNPDGTLHNVHALSKVNPEFNIAMPKFRTEITKVWDKEEFMFPLKCDVHPWMSAWVSVMSHPYFSTTKADGQFNIDNLPAGNYEVIAWHEKLGTQTQNVTVADGETKTLEFAFEAPKKQ